MATVNKRPTYIYYTDPVVGVQSEDHGPYTFHVLKEYLILDTGEQQAIKDLEPGKPVFLQNEDGRNIGDKICVRRVT